MDAIVQLLRKSPNHNLLGVAASSFLVFVIAEFIAASLCGSLSLLADAIAMSVDVVTYGFNMIAEHAKDSDNISSLRAKFIMEIIIPSFAILTLVGVTIYFTAEAVDILKNGDDRKDDVEIIYLYTFAGVNLIVDIVCIGLFLNRGKDVFIEKNSPILPQLSLDISMHSMNSEFGSLHEDNDGIEDGEEDDFYNSNMSSKSVIQTHSHTHTAFHSHNNNTQDRRRNLNMISAFAHIGGDSLRTVAVLIAAIYSTITGTSVNICDAWGAIAVSIMIILIMIPVMFDIYQASQRLKEQRDEYREIYHTDDTTNSGQDEGLI